LRLIVEGKLALDEKTRHAADAFNRVEQAFYVSVALALAAAGAVLFVNAFYSFFKNLGDLPLASNILSFLDGMLLVFIVTELIHTVRAVIAENVLMTEPFLIVGIVAAIRRLIVISAEAKDVIGRPEFGDSMIEMGVLIGAVLALGFTVFLLRHTTHPEPRPAHEPR
jgi:uncharacterized membrane protein (DUF373 family)